MDPIATIATPQELVLWSRLGAYDRAELDRLLWKEKKLFEWQAFIYPIEYLPLLRARMRRPWGPLKRQQWAKQFMRDESSTAELHASRVGARRGPLPSRELEHRSTRYRRADHLVGDPRAADVDAGAARAARARSRSQGAARTAALGSRRARLRRRPRPCRSARPRAARGEERRALGVLARGG